jgi:hypothetical protein
MTLLMMLAATLSFADSTQAYYAHKDVAGLQRLCAAAPDAETRLLCRYRLYPLTQDPRYLDDLPADLPRATPRTLALLAGLWGYQAAQSGFPAVLRYGARFDHLIRQAHQKAPADPFVLLIEGQSLLFRPRFAGGDARKALTTFRRLQQAVAMQPAAGIPPMEADLWVWYTLSRLGDPQADGLRARLLAQGPPRLFREFLESPP